MERFIYKGSKLKEISFPLGGIGTGCVGLAGNGRLIDWEIYNRPNKGSVNGFTHMAVKAESSNGLVDARILSGDLQPPYTGGHGNANYSGFGFGPSRHTLAGVPHFKEVTFIGEFPLAELNFKDPCFPGAVKLTAFNPFIPLSDKDSTIPGAFMEVEFNNETTQDLTYTLCFSISNPFPNTSSINAYHREGDVHALHLSSNAYACDAPEYGMLCLATDWSDTSYQEYWYRGAWFDNLGVFWRDFTAFGPLKNREYEQPENHEDTASLAARVLVPAGQTQKVRFILSWSFPNAHNYWDPQKSCGCSDEECSTKPNTWKNYYAVLFEDAAMSAAYGLTNWDRLYTETKVFKEALFASTMPRAAIEAVSANISILKSPTCLRLPDGSFYGFEGCHGDAGCCEGSCSHVWSYAYALPFLFPALERSMRDLEFGQNLREDGSLSFRLKLPVGRERSSFRACADGQFVTVMKVYRDYKMCGDLHWLKDKWAGVQKAIEFAWAKTNEDSWDRDRDGVLEGRQHHTLDMELFGPNAWLTGLYLGALKAGTEMATIMGDRLKAEEYRQLFDKGKAWVDQHLFNGNYFYQQIDLKDKTMVERYEDGTSLIGASTMKAYWNEEASEIKYQIGEGCGVDQVLAQWHANIIGLGEIFDPEKTKKALKSIYRHNFIKEMRNFFNPCRLYCLNDEGGVVICSWPEGTVKPVVPAPYSEETMNGFEYQAAIHMIQEGLIIEGMDIIEAIRMRYDGERRNPWNEFECGSNYARSMASYALLPAFSGFTFDMAEQRIGFQPVSEELSEHRYFWSLSPAWGNFYSNKEVVVLEVLYGEITLKVFEVPFLKETQIEKISCNASKIRHAMIGGDIIFEAPLALRQGDKLVVSLK